jgi:hypothetical protein
VPGTTSAVLVATHPALFALFCYDIGVISGALLFIGQDFHGISSIE